MQHAPPPSTTAHLGPPSSSALFERRRSSSSSRSTQSHRTSPDSSYELAHNEVRDVGSARKDTLPYPAVLDSGCSAVSNPLPSRAYVPRHEMNSSIDSTTSSFSSFNPTPSTFADSINSAYLVQDTESRYEARSYRNPSPTPSNLSTTSSRSRVSDDRGGRAGRRKTTGRKARQATVPYSRETSLGPGLEFDPKRSEGAYDEGLSDLLSHSRLANDRSNGGGYDSGDWSDSSFKNEGRVDSDSDGEDELDEDFDIELEEEDNSEPSKIRKDDTVGKRKTRQRGTILGADAMNRLDIQTEGSATVEIDMSPKKEEFEFSTDEKSLAETEERRIAFERMAGAFRSATTTASRDKARGAFVQAWLLYSYKERPAGNVCRPAIYGSYSIACKGAFVTPINSASFGKAMRQAFPKIKTRRLGVRGNSRYHYCGIGPTNATEMAILTELTEAGAGNTEESAGDESTASSVEGRASPKKTKPKSRRASILSLPEQKDRDEMVEDGPDEFDPRSESLPPAPQTPTTARPRDPNFPTSTAALQSLAPRPGPSKSRRARAKPVPLSIPDEPEDRDMEKTLGGKALTKIPISLRPINELLKGFPDIEVALKSINAREQPAEVDEDVVRVFWRSYAEVCYALLEHVRRGTFDAVETTIGQFWNSLNRATVKAVQHPQISTMIYRADAAIYDTMLDFLHAQILVPLPPTSFAAIRKIADTMERVQSTALVSFDGLAFPGPKIELAARFGHLVSRHLGLCQLAQAMMSIVNSKSTMSSLAEAWEMIDLEAVKNQSALVSNCAHELLTEYFDRFKDLLHNPGSSPTESIILWAEQVYRTAIMSPNSTSQGHSPRSILIRFNFVTSQIMRDLVLRSEPTFGSWQIISLFLDEFLGFQVLRKVALQISGVTESSTTTHHEQAPSSQTPFGYNGYSNAPPPVPHPSHQAQQPSFSSIAPSSSNFPNFDDQFSPHTRQFIDRTAAQIVQDYPTSQANLAQQNYLYQQQAQNVPFSGYQSYPSHFPSSTSDLGETGMYENYGLGLGIGTPYGDVESHGTFGLEGQAHTRGNAGPQQRFGELAFDDHSSVGFSPQLL